MRGARAAALPLTEGLTSAVEDAAAAGVAAVTASADVVACSGRRALRSQPTHEPCRGGSNARPILPSSSLGRAAARATQRTPGRGPTRAAARTCPRTPHRRIPAAECGRPRAADTSVRARTRTLWPLTPRSGSEAAAARRSVGRAVYVREAGPTWWVTSTRVRLRSSPFGPSTSSKMRRATTASTALSGSSARRRALRNNTGERADRCARAHLRANARLSRKKTRTGEGECACKDKRRDRASRWRRRRRQRGPATRAPSGRR